MKYGTGSRTRRPEMGAMPVRVFVDCGRNGTWAHYKSDYGDPVSFTLHLQINWLP